MKRSRHWEYKGGFKTSKEHYLYYKNNLNTESYIDINYSILVEKKNCEEFESLISLCTPDNKLDNKEMLKLLALASLVLISDSKTRAAAKKVKDIGKEKLKEGKINLKKLTDSLLKLENEHGQALMQRIVAKKATNCINLS